MQLLKINEKVWLNSTGIVRVEESQDGAVWVECVGVPTPDAATLYVGESQRLVDLINEENRREADEKVLRIRRAGEVVVQAIQDHGNDLGAVISEEIRGAGDATALLGPAIVAGIDRATARKDGG